MSNYNAVLARNPEGGANGLCSQTVAFSHYNHLSAQLPIDRASGALVAGGTKEQAAQCFANLKAVIEGIGHVMDDVVRLTVCLTNMADLDAVNEAQKAFYSDYLPTRTVVGAAALPFGASVQIDAVISNGEGTIPNAPQAGDLIKVYSNTAAAPVCPFSTQTVAFSHYNNISAQLPVDAATGKIVDGGIKAQAAQCFRNVKTILESIDVPFDDIVKANIFVKSLADAAAVDEVYSTFFPDSGIARTLGYVPARTVVAVGALPLDALVSVEVVVSYGDGTPPQAVEDRHGLVIRPANTDAAPRSPLSTQTVAFSHYNNISGQFGTDAAGNMVAGGAKEQAAQALANIKAIVESIGHAMEDTVRVCIYLANIADLAAVQEAYAAFYPGGIPARRVVGVAELPAGALVQIDAVLGNAEGTPPTA